MQWYSIPPLLKLWIDKVLSHGWAYGHGGKALHGKHLLWAVTTGGGESHFEIGAHPGFDAVAAATGDGNLLRAELAATVCHALHLYL